MGYGWAITILAGIYYVSSVINSLTRGRIGTAFTSFLLLMLGFFSGVFPDDLVKAADLGGLYALLNLTILIHVGTSFDLKQLKKEWRLVLVIICGMFGMAVAVFSVGWLLFGRDICLAGFPAYLGAVVATNIMHQAALAKGAVELAGFVLMVQAMQAMIGLPLIGAGMRMECRRLLELRKRGGGEAEGRAGILPGEEAEGRPGVSFKKETIRGREFFSSVLGEKKPIDRLPAVFENPFLHLFLAAFYGSVAGVIAGYTAPLTGGVIGTAVVGIVLGIAIRQLGLISKEPLQKTGMMPMLLFAMLMVMRGSLASIEPAALFRQIVPLLSLFALSAAGMGGAALLAGKRFGCSKGLVMLSVFSCFAGYPLNYQVALETIAQMAKSSEEEAYLKEAIVPKVVLGSVVCVSLTSVILAGIFSAIL